MIYKTLLPTFNDGIFGIFCCSVWFGDLGHLISFQFVSPPCCCCCWAEKLYLTLCNLMDCSTPGFPVPHYILEFAQTHVHWVSDAIQPSHLCCSLLLLPSIFPSSMTFSNGLALIGHLLYRWPKYWSFSFSISPSNESVLSGLIFYMIDWFDLLAVQGTQLLIPY